MDEKNYKGGADLTSGSRLVFKPGRRGYGLPAETGVDVTNVLYVKFQYLVQEIKYLVQEIKYLVQEITRVCSAFGISVSGIYPNVGTAGAGIDSGLAIEKAKVQCGELADFSDLYLQRGRSCF